MNHDDGHDGKPPNSRWKLVLIGFLAIAGFFLISEHRAHVFGILPYLLLLACPIMHFFGHHGRGHGRHGRGDEGTGNRDSGAEMRQSHQPPKED